MTEEADRGSWIEKVVITLLLLLRDWLMAIPFLPADTASTSSSYSSPSPASSSSAPPPPLQLALPASTVRTVFEVHGHMCVCVCMYVSVFVCKCVCEPEHVWAMGFGFLRISDTRFTMPACLPAMPAYRLLDEVLDYSLLLSWVRISELPAWTGLPWSDTTASVFSV